MPAVIGLDLGTTTITALALDTGTGRVVACRTVPTPPAMDQPTARANRREWEVSEIACAVCDVLRDLARHLGPRRAAPGAGWPRGTWPSPCSGCARTCACRPTRRPAS